MKNKIRKCKNCGHKFEVYPENPGKEYCSGKCWEIVNNIIDNPDRHYLGGHKNIKKTKRAKPKTRLKKKKKAK